MSQCQLHSDNCILLDEQSNLEKETRRKFFSQQLTMPFICHQLAHSWTLKSQRHTWPNFITVEKVPNHNTMIFKFQTKANHIIFSCQFSTFCWIFNWWIPELLYYSAKLWNQVSFLFACSVFWCTWARATPWMFLSTMMLSSIKCVQKQEGQAKGTIIKDWKIAR